MTVTNGLNLCGCTLPAEIVQYAIELSYLRDAKFSARASRVCRKWRQLCFQVIANRTGVVRVRFRLMALFTEQLENIAVHPTRWRGPQPPFDPHSFQTDLTVFDLALRAYDLYRSLMSNWFEVSEQGTEMIFERSPPYRYVRNPYYVAPIAPLGPAVLGAMMLQLPENRQESEFVNAAAESANTTFQRLLTLIDQITFSVQTDGGFLFASFLNKIAKSPDSLFYSTQYQGMLWRRIRSLGSEISRLDFECPGVRLALSKDNLQGLCTTISELANLSILRLESVDLRQNADLQMVIGACESNPKLRCGQVHLYKGFLPANYHSLLERANVLNGCFKIHTKQKVGSELTILQSW